MPELVGRFIKITGTVQGVGFRPFIYNLALARGLKGHVSNRGEGVLIEVEGREDEVNSFIATLRADPPTLAGVDGMTVQPAPLCGYRDFRIIFSEGEATGEAVVPHDAATCRDCRREMEDPGDRHYRYAFTNCTACGPRFTIVRGLPYDRKMTSMAVFPMCPDCAREYSDPTDRRFHAQPVACPACGPSLELVARGGRRLSGDPIKNCREFLLTGRIVAVKSLGGFHLACSASDRAAILALRRRKRRPAKPFAIMCRDLGTVHRHCLAGEREAALLTSSAAPIVILQKRPDSGLPAELAPGLNSLAVMLPYTPLHLLLFGDDLPVLVMTSGNLSELPLAVDNRQALLELGDLADYFLWHNRDIVNRCDDSVLSLAGGEVQFFRRSRGYVPQPLAVPAEELPPAPATCIPAGGGVPAGPPGGDGPIRTAAVLGAGGEMKNTFCLLLGGRAYLSQHNGEMDLVEGQNAFTENLEGFCRFLHAEPQVIAYDLHPDYHVSRLAKSLPAAYHTGVQHHHAHMAACMAENGLIGPVIGVILDGTGYGTDGRLWGFEVLRGDYKEFSREYHLAYVPLPGGERAVRNPWITAFAYLITFLGEKGRQAAERLFPERAGELKLIEKVMDAGLNAPGASSCGRLFDAAAAMLGVCLENTYEGQAAVELSELAFYAEPPGVPPMAGRVVETYPVDYAGPALQPGPLLAGVLKDIEEKLPAAYIAGRLFATVAAAVAEAVQQVGGRTGIKDVVLSGGCWHSRSLLSFARHFLEEKGYNLYTHRHVPPGDGGISLGQALVGYHRWAELNRGESTFKNKI
ncbi:MAG: carbamoyltransferase HypF [Eubacteriales bacterium]